MKSWLFYVVGTVFLAFGLVFVRSLAQIGVGQVELGVGEAVRFPNVTGTNLEGRKFNLPEDFEAE
jgi:hypothetical protein